MGFILFLFLFFVGGGWLIARLIGKALFGKKQTKQPYTFIDKTTHIHNHYHDNRSIHINGEELKNLKK